MHQVNPTEHPKGAFDLSFLCSVFSKKPLEFVVAGPLVHLCAKKT
jgi:hypothetical protein